MKGISSKIPFINKTKIDNQKLPRQEEMKSWSGNGFEPMCRVYETLPIPSANRPNKEKLT